MSVESFGAAASHLKFPDDLTNNTDYAGNYMMFTAMKVSGGVDTRTLKFDYAEGSPGVVCLPIPTHRHISTVSCLTDLIKYTYLSCHIILFIWISELILS